MFKDKTVNVFLQQLANHRQKGYQSIVTRVLAISWGLWYRDNRWYFPFLGDFPVSVLCMSVEFFSCTPSDGAAWSLLVGCIQQQHCCWPCSCTMLLGSILTPYSIVLCLCTFCGLYILFHILWPVYSVYSVACIFCLFCGQRLLYAQSHSDEGHAVTDPAPSDEELNDSHLPQLFVPSTSPSMTEQEAVCHSVQQRQPSP